MKNTKNNFKLEEILEEKNSLSYLFKCNKTGESKQYTQSLVLDMFKSSFLITLNQQLQKEKASRISSEDLSDKTWEFTCQLLNVNNSFKDTFQNNKISLNKELFDISEDDILDLNLTTYDFFNADNEDDSNFIIFRGLDSDSLELFDRDEFSMLVYDETLRLDKVYKSEGISKRMIELNLEAIKNISLEHNIFYSENNNAHKTCTCNHEFKFIKRVTNDSVTDDMFYYYFECSHCGEHKYILNSEILDYIHHTSLELIKCQLNTPREKRLFNFYIFDLAIDKFIHTNQLKEGFKLDLKDDYDFPSINKELCVVNESDLSCSQVILSNTIVKHEGIFSKKIIKNAKTYIQKSNGKIKFTTID